MDSRTLNGQVRLSVICIRCDYTGSWTVCAARSQCCSVCGVRRPVCICLCERGLNTPCLTNCFHNLGTDWSLPGREWSPACRLWLKIALLLYMRFPILLPIPFIYGVAAPWYTCLELVEITFEKKERHSQSLGAINLTGSLSFSLSLAFFLFPSLHLSAPTLSFSLLLSSILSLSLRP